MRPAEPFGSGGAGKAKDVVRWNVSNPDRLKGFLDGSFCRVPLQMAMHRVH
jgi:hypothetical protein